MTTTELSKPRAEIDNFSRPIEDRGSLPNLVIHRCIQPSLRTTPRHPIDQRARYLKTD
ncbi:hypothetical protein H6778_02170 [Candidatus Nomurabacteria bacterium]|nr:hypothetical protein [Candidatus Nomurabacteria bacterium]